LQRDRGLIEALEVVPIPKLLAINPVAALDLAVLFRVRAWTSRARRQAPRRRAMRRLS
jgi:hypothetical protein